MASIMQVSSTGSWTLKTVDDNGKDKRIKLRKIRPLEAKSPIPDDVVDLAKQTGYFHSDKPSPTKTSNLDQIIADYLAIYEREKRRRAFSSHEMEKRRRERAANGYLIPATRRMISPRRWSFTCFAALAAGSHWKSRSFFSGHFRLWRRTRNA